MAGLGAGGTGVGVEPPRTAGGGMVGTSSCAARAAVALAAGRTELGGGDCAGLTGTGVPWIVPPSEPTGREAGLGARGGSGVSSGMVLADGDPPPDEMRSWASLALRS
ncbi:MAG: hypothetical protein OXT09_06650, partial [Myxococcales bacterium]|nr:hypothetical protein [Myxococcales bacterium]